MSAYKMNIREEIAVRQWQQVIDLGIKGGVNPSAAQCRDSDEQHNSVIFEVMP